MLIKVIVLILLLSIYEIVKKLSQNRYFSINNKKIYKFFSLILKEAIFFQLLLSSLTLSKIAIIFFY